MPPKNITVVGGGITGLTSAFYLSRKFPQAQIRLLEKASREGGWIRSRRVEVEGCNGEKANVLLESGPRTLRPNGAAVLELINLLGLRGSVITASKTSPAARNRFLHMPGRRGITRLPTSVLGLIGSPSLALVLASRILFEATRFKNRSENLKDESFRSLLNRRFGSKFERLFGSALVHGIYAADSSYLSARAAFPLLPQAEERGNGSIVRGLLKANEGSKDAFSGYELDGIDVMMKDAAIFSFMDGMETLPKALKKYLDISTNVTVDREAEVVFLQPSHQSDGVELKLASGETIRSSHVVSAIPLPQLKGLTQDVNPLPHLLTNPSSSVTVINLVFPPSTRPIHPPGFGYLIPRPRCGYTTRTSGFLGVVFDSCALPEQDQGAPGFTRITAMLGGPHAPAMTEGHTAPEQVLAQLQLALAPKGPRLPWPVHFEATEQRNCIPVPMVGHLERMDELRRSIKEGPWNARLEVVGAGVGGVSVSDCVEAGRSVGKDW